MNVKYSRLRTSEVVNSFDKWTKNKLPVAFLKQQIFLVSLVILSFTLFILTSLFTTNVEYELIQNLSNTLQYGVIVDCGSSGSRAHVFKWRKGSILDRVEFVRNEKTGDPLTKHITPGVSSLKDNPDKASDYMEPIMEFLSNVIPQDRHADTSIYFMATAGMRILEESTQKRIMSDLSQDLRAKFNFPKIKTQVISGEYEGVYSWLSLNMNKKLYNRSGSSKSYGMIEMGGASTQITFELEPEVENQILRNLKDTDAITAFKSEQRTLNLSPTDSVKLFTTTFLGLGVNSARGAAIDLLVLDHLALTNNNPKKNGLSNFEVRLRDPCLTNGSSEIVLRPTALLEGSGKTIGFEIREKEETFRVRLEGAGDYFDCKSLLDKSLSMIKGEKLHCPSSGKSPCSMSLLGTNFMPFSYYPFIGLSEFYFTTNEMMNADGQFNRTKVLHETKRICETRYNDLLEMYSQSGVTHKDRILYECFKASWLLAVLHNHGFNMPEDYDNFTTLDSLAGEKIDWTIGAMVTEVALSKLNLDRK